MGLPLFLSALTGFVMFLLIICHIPDDYFDEGGDPMQAIHDAGVKRWEESKAKKAKLDDEPSESTSESKIKDN